MTTWKVITKNLSVFVETQMTLPCPKLLNMLALYEIA